jgi:Protein of unknown function (DUF669)
MPVFTDEVNKTAAPKGEYVLEVLSREAKLSKNGDPMHKLKLRVEGHGAILFENLTESPKAQWRIDTFLKAAGVKIKKGETYEFDEEKAKENECRFVNVAGLRAWAQVIVNENDWNEVKMWVFGKALPPKPAEPEEEGGF